MNAVSPWCDPVVAEVHAIREDLACESAISAEPYRQHFHRSYLKWHATSAPVLPASD